jgi:hypothetical protein
MGCLRYPRKQTSASAAAMTDPDPNPFADCDAIVCCGGGQQASISCFGRAQEYRQFFVVHEKTSHN